MEHKQCDIIEIVCSDSTSSQEAPRIYVRNSILRSKICDDEIQSRLFDLTEPILQRKGTITPTDKEILLRQVWKNAMYEYVDERLELHKKLAGSKAFHLMLRKPLFSEGSEANSAVPLICDPPPSLVRYELDHFTAPRHALLLCIVYNTLVNIVLFQFCRESIVEESKEIVTAESAATTHSSLPTHSHPEANLTIVVAAVLTVRERWRIPIVFAKVSRGRRLNRPDAHIWKVVSSNLLCDSDLHERLAIAHLESPTLCADFAARQYIRMPAMAPESPSKFVRPPPIDTSPVAAHGRHFHTHQQHSSHPSPKISPKPSADRFSKPEPGHSGSFKFGIEALSSSLSRGLQSLGSSLDTKNKQYRAAAAADLDSNSRPHNTPTGFVMHKELDFHVRSESTAGMDTPTSLASASRVHRQAAGSPRRHSRNTPRAGGLRSPLFNHNNATPRGMSKLTTPRHQVPASPMAAGRDHSLTVGVFDESELTSPRRLREAKEIKHAEPHKQREWFAVSLSRKLAGLVGAAPGQLASFTGSSKKHARVAVSGDEEADDNASVGADIAVEDCSFYQPSPEGVVQYGEDGLEVENNSFGVNSANDGNFSGGDVNKVHVHVNGTDTPPYSRPNTTPHAAVSNSVHTPSNTAPATPSRGGGIGGAFSNIISNLSGKHANNSKAIKVKKAQSTPHSPHAAHNAHSSPHPNTSAHGSVAPGSPGEGPVQKFFQLITLRGRNVVIRPAVTIKHDTVVQFY